MTTADEIIEAVGSLTGSERNQIRAVLALLAPGDAEATRGQSDATEMLWNAVRTVVGPHFQTLGVVKKMGFGSKVRIGAEATANYTTRYMPKLTHTERIAAYRHMVRALLVWMEGRNMPITPKTVAYSLATLPEAVDRQFPGYAEAGMLRFALMLDVKE